ncbi:MAG: 50S ribosomal protein L10 [Bacillota bacterium]
MKEDKIKAVDELKETLQAAKAVFVADYRGIPVGRLTELRRRLRAADGRLKVAKNTLTRIAAKEAGMEALISLLEGPVALAFSFGEPATTAKVLNEFNREFKLLEIKGGVLDGRLISSSQVKVLADLPPFEVLVARAIGGMKGPLYGLVNVLGGPLRNLVYVLEAVREKQAAAS